MSTETFTGTVEGMTCEHCVASVTEEVTAIPGVTGVRVSLESGGLEIDSDRPVAAGAVRAAVEEAGYTLA